VPKKLMVYASHFAEAFHDAQGFGWTVGETRFDWSALIAEKDREIARLEGLYEKSVAAAGAEIFAMRATVADPRAVEAATRPPADGIRRATPRRSRALRPLQWVGPVQCSYRTRLATRCPAQPDLRPTSPTTLKSRRVVGGVAIPGVENILQETG